MTGASAATKFHRTAFQTSRLLDFCSRKELIAQTGHQLESDIAAWIERRKRASTSEAAVGTGKSAANLELIDAAREILEGIHPAAVRAVCYKLFAYSRAVSSPGWTRTRPVGSASSLVYAREHDLIDWEWIVDETRGLEGVATWSDPDAYIKNCRDRYPQDLWEGQPRRVRVWSEKGTVRGTLWPVLSKYGVDFQVMHGFGSYTALRQAAEDFFQEEFDFIYVGDLDPSGMYMSEVDAPDVAKRSNTSRINIVHLVQ